MQDGKPATPGKRQSLTHHFQFNPQKLEEVSTATSTNSPRRRSINENIGGSTRYSAENKIHQYFFVPVFCLKSLGSALSNRVVRRVCSRIPWSGAPRAINWMARLRWQHTSSDYAAFSGCFLEVIQSLTTRQFVRDTSLPPFFSVYSLSHRIIPSPQNNQSPSWVLCLSTLRLNIIGRDDPNMNRN